VSNANATAEARTDSAHATVPRHLAHYCMLYLRNGWVEIASTNQFTDWTGKSELSLVATEPIPTRTRIPFLTSSTSSLTLAQERALGRHGRYGTQNFSILTQRNKKGRLLLGPVRFANVSPRYRTHNWYATYSFISMIVNQTPSLNCSGMGGLCAFAPSRISPKGQRLQSPTEITIVSPMYSRHPPRMLIATSSREEERSLSVYDLQGTK